MQIIITESQEAKLLNLLLNETYMQSYGDKALLIKKYLDSNFMRGSSNQLDDNGYPSKMELVVMLNPDKTPMKTMSDKQLFYLLQDKFKNILNGEERDEFLKKVMVAWYNKKITKNGNIQN